MRKFAVLLNKENETPKLAIEIVSEEKLKNSDGKTFESEKDYINYMYGEENVIAFTEIGSNEKVAEICVYKEGVFSTPMQEEIEKDLKFVYW